MMLVYRRPLGFTPQAGDSSMLSIMYYIISR
jgi:hypothetical protein